MQLQVLARVAQKASLGYLWFWFKIHGWAGGMGGAAVRAHDSHLYGPGFEPRFHFLENSYNQSLFQRPKNVGYG